MRFELDSDKLLYYEKTREECMGILALLNEIVPPDKELIRKYEMFLRGTKEDIEEIKQNMSAEALAIESDNTEKK